ncbi:sensor histidine kinase [Flavobacterium geliluteum]|uniref:Histidine kinase n=1 Tax=Flavobacterium geliluteum TaxID=2816120 RepID=A0A940X7N8_9FLAO|nr:histidine kinase [Flavobacterium geliluteum]MBP4138394.1 histidine kinase [Flavobacterium geliluteum]
MSLHLKDNIKKFQIIDAFIITKYRVYRHALGWIFLFLMLISLKPIKESNLIGLSVSLFIILSVFYINLYVLLPAFLYNKFFFKYLGLLLLLLFLSLLISIKLSDILEDPADLNVDKPSFLFQFIAYCVILLPFIVVSTGVKIIQKWIIYDNRFKELEKNTIEMELKALRNQINPHFIFNTLNNLNYMIMKDQQKASIILSQLSNILSHHLYESNQKYIFLHSEIKFINDYIHLEVIRRDEFKFEVISLIDDTVNIKIPSNIFSVFIENAIKHSLDCDFESSIKVSFEKIDDYLLFSCLNTKGLSTEKKMNHGVGLKNVKRRLELIYAESYELTITDAKRTYKVELKLPL